MNSHNNDLKKVVFTGDNAAIIRAYLLKFAIRDDQLQDHIAHLVAQDMQTRKPAGMSMAQTARNLRC